MKKLFSVHDTLPNKISYYHLLFFLVSLPFDRFYGEIIFLSFAVHTIIHLKRTHLKIPKKVWLLQLAWLVTVLSTIYSADRSQGWAECVKRLPIFLFPLVLSISSLNIKKYKSSLLMGFALGITITVAYLYSDAIAIIQYNKLPVRTILSASFLNRNFAAPINMHPTFLSMYIVLSIVYFLHAFYIDATKRENIFYALCILLLFAGLIQLSSKSAFIALVIVLIAFSYCILQGKTRWRFLLVYGSVLLLFIITVMNATSLKKRYITDLKNDITNDSVGTNKNEYRIARWKIAAELIKASPVFGYGTGSEKMLLKEKYFKEKLYTSYINELDAHNQYISFLIESGIIGLMAWLYPLLYFSIQAIKRKDIFLLSFIILIVIVSFTEDILKVNKGIFFYSFFFSFFFSGMEDLMQTNTAK